MRDKPERDPAVDDRRRCKKNSSVLSCIDKRIKKAVTLAAKSSNCGEGPIPLRKFGIREKDEASSELADAKATKLLQ